MDARGRLQRAARVMDLVTLAQALDVSEADLQRCLRGEVAYPSHPEGERRLEQVEAVCRALGVDDLEEVEAELGLVEVEGGVSGLGGGVDGWVERVAGDVEADEGLVVEGGGANEWVVAGAEVELGLMEKPVGGDGKRAYARFGDASAKEVLGIAEEPDVALGLDTDGDGKVDIELPGAVAVPRKGNWNEEIERRRESLWTAWSIARMTQHRLMKHSEAVAALGWVAEIELALISFYGETLPQRGASWDMERQTREVNLRLSRLRWVAEEQEKEYGGVKGVMKWLMGDRRPGGKELYQRMVEEADKLLDAVDIGLDPGGGVLQAVMQQREGVLQRRGSGGRV